jgi:hypothetical protein
MDNSVISIRDVMGNEGADLPNLFPSLLLMEM